MVFYDIARYELGWTKEEYLDSCPRELNAHYIMRLIRAGTIKTKEQIAEDNYKKNSSAIEHLLS